MSKNNNKSIITEDIGMSMILTTLPKSDEEAFVQNEIIDVFKTYKRKLRDKSDIEENLYRPIMYGLFGRYDMIVLSLIDDFEFAAKTFMPYNHLLKEIEYNKPFMYDYKVISGVFVGKKEESESKTFSELINDYYSDRSIQNKHRNNNKKNIFNNGPSIKFPFISVTNLMLNPLISIGNGGIIYKPLKSIIDKIIKDSCEDSSTEVECDIKYVLLSTFTYNEFSLIIFGNSYKKLHEIIAKIRRITLINVEDNIYPEEVATTNKRGYFYNSLMKLLLEEKNKNYNYNDVRDNHLFANTNSEFGYDIRFLVQNPEDLVSYFYSNSKMNQKDIYISIHLGIKSGHIPFYNKRFKKYIKDHYQKKSIYNTFKPIHGIGKSDMIFKFKKDEKVTFENYLNVLSLLKKIDLQDKKPSIEHITSTIAFVLTDDEGGNLDNHFELYNSIPKLLLISQEIINDISKKLKQLGISVIRHQQVLSIFSMYNKNIESITNFLFFVELHGLMKAIEEKILNFKDDFTKRVANSYDVLLEMDADLDEMITAFSYAFKNRYFQSFETLNVTESNMTYKGGVQQLLSGYDALFKLYSNIIYGENGGCRKVSFITRDTIVRSSYVGIRLNYFHVFQPLNYLMVAGHESANFLLNTLIHDASIKGIETPQGRLTDKFRVDIYELVKWVKIFNLKKPKDKEERNLYRIFDDKKASLFQENMKLEETGLVSKSGNGLYNEYGIKSTIEYMIVDLFSFKYSYLENYELFSFWHWMFFLQMTDIYYDYENIKEDAFITMYLRMEVLRRVYKIEQSQSDILFDVMSLVDRAKNNVSAYKKALDEIVNTILKTKGVLDALKFFKGINDNICEKQKYEKYKDKIEQFQYDSTRKKGFGKGIYYDINRGSSIEKLKFEAIKVTYLYLFELYSFIDEDRKKDGRITKKVYLSRALDGEIINLQSTTNISANQRGGLFVKDKDVRKMYFRMRMTLAKTLWHISQILKLRKIENIKAQKNEQEN